MQGKDDFICEYSSGMSLFKYSNYITATCFKFLNKLTAFKLGTQYKSALGGKTEGKKERAYKN
jgi:hypothetical protein